MLRAALLTAACALVLVAAGSSAAATPGGCTSSRATCLPDGSVTLPVWGGNGCDWTATITWGDGPAQKVSFHGTRNVGHKYRQRGFYRVRVHIGGKPSPGVSVHCGSSDAMYYAEYPFTAPQAKVLRQVNKLAHDSRPAAKKLPNVFKQIKEQGGAKAPKPLLKEGTDVTRKLVDQYGAQARDLAKQWATDKLTTEFKKKFAATVGVGEESLEKLWGFLGSLGQLNQFPSTAVKAADARYKNDPNFADQLDKLALLGGCTNGDYRLCTPDQKRYIDVSAGVIVQDGASKTLINDTIEAQKAAAKVSFSLPGQ